MGRPRVGARWVGRDAHRFRGIALLLTSDAQGVRRAAQEKPMSATATDRPSTAHLGSLEHIDDATRTQLEAAAFRRLVAHLQWRTDAQNIDLMGLSGFCRNCLSKWLRAGAKEAGVELSDADARHAIYGMPYGEWKAAHQTPATDAQKARYADTSALHAKHDL